MPDVPARSSSSQAALSPAASDQALIGDEANQALVASLLKAFEARFGRRATHLVSAPGRVNLIGEHIDYCDGFVLPMAIRQRTFIAADFASTPTPPNASPNAAAFATVHTLAADASADPAELVARFPLDASLAPGEPFWSNYLRGVVAGFTGRGVSVPAFEAVVASNVPFGSGLSSSAALEVATATLLEALTGQRLPAMEKALLCQKAEHTYANMPCGIMDQAISALAEPESAMLLDCRSLEPRMVHIPAGDVVVLIANSHVKHALAESQYTQRRRQCEQAAATLGVSSLRDVSVETLEEKRGLLEPEVYRRARHAVTEIRRTSEAARLLERGDWAGVGQLMNASHVSLRDDYQVSCEELDVLVDLAHAFSDQGVFGSRMTGAGFGGCTVTLLREQAVEPVTRHLMENYPRHAKGVKPTIFTTRPAPGAMQHKL